MLLARFSQHVWQHREYSLSRFENLNYASCTELVMTIEIIRYRRPQPHYCCTGEFGLISILTKILNWSLDIFLYYLFPYYMINFELNLVLNRLLIIDNCHKRIVVMEKIERKRG